MPYKICYTVYLEGELSHLASKEVAEDIASEDRIAFKSGRLDLETLLEGAAVKSITVEVKETE